MSLPSYIRSLQEWDDVENVDLKHGSPAVLDDVEKFFFETDIQNSLLIE